MADEELQNDIPEAPEVAPAPVAEQSNDAPFSTPYEAFKYVPEFQGQDDLTIARNLYQAYNGYSETQRQLQQYQQYASEYARNADAFRQWQASQAQASQPQPKQEEKPKWWNPPTVDESYKHYIVRDPQTGREVVDPNAPLHAQEALRKYQDYTANFARKFVTDPEGTLKPFIEEVAMQKAKELVEGQLGEYQTKNYVQTLEKQNSDWLYDARGNVTPEGQAIQAYIEEAKQYGIQTAEARWKFATGMLQRDLLNIRNQQLRASGQPQIPVPQAPAAPAPRPAAPVNPDMQFLRERATRTPNRSAGKGEPRAPAPSRMSFEDRLTKQLVYEGLME